MRLHTLLFPIEAAQLFEVLFVYEIRLLAGRAGELETICILHFT